MGHVCTGFDLADWGDAKRRRFTFLHLTLSDTERDHWAFGLVYVCVSMSVTLALGTRAYVRMDRTRQG